MMVISLNGVLNPVPLYVYVYVHVYLEHAKEQYTVTLTYQCDVCELMCLLFTDCLSAFFEG